MKTVLIRFAKLVVMVVAVSAMALGFARTHASAARMHHCAMHPFPDPEGQHCDTVDDCFPECEGAALVRCAFVADTLPGCCECIF